jgi:glutathione synthase/RimK-type ligase-like ATP-grasp enzyme
LFRIAIQPEKMRLTSGRTQSFSDEWAERLRRDGHEPVLVDATKSDFFDRVRECDGFMWWFAHLPYPRNFARRIVQAVQHGMGLPLFPTWETIWHFDDKISQHYLLEAAGIPTARTDVFWWRNDALNFCREAKYPLVIKLAGGITSENVRLLKDFDEAQYWIHRMFGPGAISLEKPTLGGVTGLRQRVKDSMRLLVKGLPPSPSRRSDLHLDYVLVQEFLPDNGHDTRVTVIGNRAFGFRRMNRPNDFRASGSGRIDWDPSKVDTEMVRLAFRAARKLRSQSLAVDGMYREGGQRVLVEISYYYEGWALHACPGHWELRGDPETGRLEWVDGQVRPEDAILDDFLDVLRRRERPAAPAAPVPKSQWAGATAAVL